MELIALTSVTLFSDFSCPYSYVMETALRRVNASEIEIVYRAYELYPAPSELPPPEPGSTIPDGLRILVEEEELPLGEVAFRPRTRKAHEAARFARERGREAEMRERILAAYWGEGRDIGRIDVLMEVAAEAGLDPEELKIALDLDRFGEEVEHDEEVARRLRVPGTPTLFIGTGAGAQVLAGAYGSRELRRLIHDAIRTRAEPPEDG